MLDIGRHKTILLQILKDIYTDVSIAPALGFKGGTACFLFYDLPRFSVDLDFDLIDSKKEGAVFEKVGNILKEYGELREKYKKRNTIFFLLSYERGTRNIKVEISLRNFGSTYELKNYLGISMLVMKKEDIFANKLVALTERGQIANRDLYDIWFFFKNRWKINTEIVKKRAGLEFKEFLKKCIRITEGVSTTHILAGLGDLLDEGQKRLVKEKLKEELLFLLKLRLKES